MSDNQVNNLLGVTMDKIKQMVDVNTVIGDPVTTPDGTTVIPVSRVSYGFASGVRTKKLLPEYEWVREGINTQWFATGKSQVSCGNMSNNVSVRIKRV